MAEPALEDPDLFLAIEDIELVARILVDGTVTGMHRSRSTGGGSEFYGYRDYFAGDDLRRVDWNLWARSDRLCTKVTRVETNMPVYVLVDASGSMQTATGPCRKWLWASRAAAALVLCALRGRDPAGLLLLTDCVSDVLPAKIGANQFPDALALLTKTRPSGKSGLVTALHEARTFCQRRGVVIIISDLFAPDEVGDGQLAAAIGDFSHAGHDVLVIHLLDPVEMKLPHHGKFLARDLETGATLRTDVQTLHEAYAKVVGKWVRDHQTAGESSGVTWLSVSTADAIADTLATALAQRARN